MNIGKRGIIIGIVFLLLALAVAFYAIEQKKRMAAFNAGIEIENITNGQIITSPLLIKGKVTGGKWTGFEGQVGKVELIDASGEVLGSASLTATSDWTLLPTNFETSMSFSSPASNNVSLIFFNENPSGLPEREDTVSFSLIASGENQTVKVYFGKKDAVDVCTQVFPVERSVVRTEAVARAAIEELIKGPSADEKASGYFSGIDINTKINKLTIVGGTAAIDFNEALEEGVGGSCKVTEIRNQIVETLKQFSSVNNVIISIDGRTEDILQP